MSSLTSIPSTSSIQTTSSRRCQHGAYGPICMCASSTVASSSASTSIEPTSTTKLTSSSRRCRHGSYGPMCMCTSSSRSAMKAAAPQTDANMDAEPKASLGDQIRAMLKLKTHKRCSHGSYGPACICDIKVGA